MIVNPKTLRRSDWAYICFAWIALAVWFEELVNALPLSSGWRQFIFMLLWIPILFAALLAIVAALILSIVEWRERPLLIMAGALASMMFLFFALDERGFGNSHVDPVWYVGGTAILLVFCIRRLAMARTRRDA